jgi:TPP-dependent pyruvate/acetoin dehydrogenase alpha subunit
MVLSESINLKKRRDHTLKDNQYSREMLLQLLEGMQRVRKFETKITECFAKGMLAGNIHTCIGQEAICVGACAALEPTDYITGTHRGHGQCIAKGAVTDRMFAELCGKETGYCRGKGGSMHVVDVSLGILGANGIVGAGLPIATGSGLASKVKKTSEVTLAFFGDGASNNGTFHESLNMAAAWKLPVVYLCENNEYGVSVNIHTVTNTENIAVRAKGYDIPGKTVDGNDILAVYEAVKEAVAYARAGNGPSIVECKTYRMRGHYEGDPAVYRPKEITEAWKEKDPIKLYSEFLLNSGVSQKELDAVDRVTIAEIEGAYNFAMNSPYPDINETDWDVYSSDNERCVNR